ncbi:hypothetical protein MWH03_00640 [Klebsiella pneumoniae]|nr:hypothetical protein [Klebsiella pneumoniae]
MEKKRVAAFLDAAIIAAGETHASLAEKLGYDSVNIISMFRCGKTHLPLSKVSDFARVLRVDEMELLKLVLQERQPEVFKILEEHGAFLTPDEELLLRRYRSGEALTH